MIWESKEQDLIPNLPHKTGGISGFHFIKDY